MPLNPDFERIFAEETAARGLCDQETIDQALRIQQEGVELHEERCICDILMELEAITSRQAKMIADAIWKNLDIAPEVEGYDGLEKIHNQGAAILYLAHQQSVDRQVVLKVVSLKAMSDPAAQQRFNEEAQLRARLNHRNIVGSIDFGKNDVCYYSVLVNIHNGRYLYELVCPGGGKSLSLPTPNALAHYMAGITDALHHIEKQGMAHGNVSPENIIVIPNGDAYLTGFDYVTKLGNELPVIPDSTVRFPAPENAAKPSARTEMYALGCTLFMALTGLNPLKAPPGTTPSALDFRKKAHPGLAAIAYTLMQPDPAKRYNNYDELREDFDAVAGGKKPARALPLPSLSQNIADKLPDWPASPLARILLYLGGAAAGVATAAGIFLIVHGFPPPPPTVPAEFAQRAHWRDTAPAELKTMSEPLKLWQALNDPRLKPDERKLSALRLTRKYPDSAYAKAAVHLGLAKAEK